MSKKKKTISALLAEKQKYQDVIDDIDRQIKDLRQQNKKHQQVTVLDTLCKRYPRINWDDITDDQLVNLMMGNITADEIIAMQQASTNEQTAGKTETAVEAEEAKPEDAEVEDAEETDTPDEHGGRDLFHQYD